MSRSAFYDWQSRREGPTDAEWDEARLINEIRDLHAASDGTYGEPRITAELVDKGWVVNLKRTARLMRENRLQGYRPRRRLSLTKADEGGRGRASRPDPRQITVPQWRPFSPSSTGQAY